MKIVAGIDFGTSMTMIQTLCHETGKQEMMECKPVRFTQSAQAATPTLVRIDWENGNEWFGEEAQNVSKGEMYENFKLDLWSDDVGRRERARDLVERFFKYLYSCYQEEKNKLYLGAQNIEEETVVGHPVQWDEAERSVIIEAAKKAGFKNVRAKDEATASVLCVLTHNQEALRQSGYLQKGKPLHVMVLDMGAGTTDLAFVKVEERDGRISVELMGTWPPKDYPEVFGGSQIDRVLAKRMTQWLGACGMQDAMAESYIRSNYLPLKNWKEYNVSADLEKRKRVDDCMALSMAKYMLGSGMQPFPAFGREEFETMMEEELRRFVNTIASAPQELRAKTDLVFLTGGNSQWYWVDDILTGRNMRFGDAGLPKLRNQASALQRTTYPTETVSRGLVYEGKSICFVEEAEVKDIQDTALQIQNADEAAARAEAVQALIDSLTDRQEKKIGDPAEAKTQTPPEGKKESDPAEEPKLEAKPRFVEWFPEERLEKTANEEKQRRQQTAYPDMQMMDRLYLCQDGALAVTDSGRILYVKHRAILPAMEHSRYSQVENAQTIISDSVFCLKDGTLVDTKGNKIWREKMSNLTRDRFPDCVNKTIGITDAGDVKAYFRKDENCKWRDVIGGDEDKKIGKDMKREGIWPGTLQKLECWTAPLRKMRTARVKGNIFVDEVAIGLTVGGSLAVRRSKVLRCLQKMYPMLNANTDGTLENNIVDFRLFGDNKLFLLRDDGRLELHEEGKKQTRSSSSR